MKVAVVRETRPGEARVAMVPELVGELTALGCLVLVEPGAGDRAEFTDEAYVDAGAVLDEGAVRQADLVLAVQPPDPAVVREMRSGAALISFLPVRQEREVVVALRDAGVTSFAMELVPRISRAQPMDALSSQAFVAGYRAAIVASGLLRRFLPMSITAAGTVPPAEVVVLGAGVAGLQAIATMQRLGAVVRAYDVRASAAEEIASLGAVPIDLGLAPLDGAAGYAREMTAARSARQQELLAPYVANADVLITTAAVPGLRAPVLVSRAMVEAMRPGSVVVDIAAEAGGNVEGVRPGEIVRIGQAQVWGGADVTSQLPAPASQLYARNVLSLLTSMTLPGDSAVFAPDFADEIVAGCAVTRDGAIVHPPTRDLIGG
ncbi:NAD(P) transhydrogenase subunit alpha [Nocardioides marmoriginsengisoli]|uniref:proton-translocating NAD(P)(+) transhydrogenase n=1 Tax=Nocardioides marmoriginsengisoli TaxID=661483 RepID=A0A3N0CAT2_9ACTN|nr:NAD(P) transhydrogenase subunit alpha [Nocardioides marmoriginsengisoli]RNL60574.1 NAD(P) transhydrogenase subunit alpha [Nocardioides marmoriginsengisoli]